MNATAAVWLACAIAMLSAPLPVSADAPTAEGSDLRALQERIAQAPADTDARYALARAYARAARFADAAAEYDALLSRDADNADWLFGKAQTLLATGRPQEAAAMLERARHLAPGYEEVWRTEAAALEAAGDETAALALLDTAAARFPAAQWPTTRGRQLREARLARAGTRLSASAAYEDLSGGNPSWRSGAVALVHSLTSSTRLAAAFAIEQRYDEQDEQFGLGIVHRLAGDWFIDVGGELAPDGKLLPESQLHLEVSRRLTRAVSGSVRYRHASYAAVEVDALAGSAEYGFGNHRVAYTLTATKPSDIDTRFGHALRLARDYGAGSSVSLLLARGEEAETVAPGRVLVTRNTAVALFGTHWRSAAWGLSWSCGWNEQGELYDRLGVRLGLEHRF
ncbi:MAG: YaiO family outer membrane beta-barrel protein [Gammaproteobacteria bacterium]